jgi:hypothetical protein
MAEYRDPLVYYTLPGLMTSAGEQAGMLKGLPDDIPGLCRVVQQNLLHVHWAKSYGVTITPDDEQEVQLRRASSMLARIATQDDRMLTVPRPVEKRLVGNCRDFSVMLCTLLRHQGIPARPRCGFGTYFTPDWFEDHWICEVWNDDEARWMMVDAQLDALQVEALGITFDTCDLPEGSFIPAGKGWQMCRAGEADPSRFGIFDIHGLWFVRGNLLRDFASLNRMELLPWDSWGLCDREPDADDLALLDHVAALTLAGNETFEDVRALYEAEQDRLRVPDEIHSYNSDTPTIIDLRADELEMFPT